MSEAPTKGPSARGLFQPDPNRPIPKVAKQTEPTTQVNVFTGNESGQGIRARNQNPSPTRNSDRYRHHVTGRVDIHQVIWRAGLAIVLALCVLIAAGPRTDWAKVHVVHGLESLGCISRPVLPLDSALPTANQTEYILHELDIIHEKLITINQNSQRQHEIIGDRIFTPSVWNKFAPNIMLTGIDVLKAELDRGTAALDSFCPNNQCMHEELLERINLHKQHSFEAVHEATYDLTVQAFWTSLYSWFWKSAQHPMNSAAICRLHETIIEETEMTSDTFIMHWDKIRHSRKLSYNITHVGEVIFAGPIYPISSQRNYSLAELAGCDHHRGQTLPRKALIRLTRLPETSLCALLADLWEQYGHQEKNYEEMILAYRRIVDRFQMLQWHSIQQVRYEQCPNYLQNKRQWDDRVASFRERYSKLPDGVASRRVKMPRAVPLVMEASLLGLVGGVE